MYGFTRRIKRMRVLFAAVVFMLFAVGTVSGIIRPVSVEAAEMLPAPVLVSATPLTYNTIKVTWKPVPGADFYNIYYREKNGEWQTIASNLTSCEYIHYSSGYRRIRPGVKYYYTVRPSKDLRWGDYDKIGIGVKTSLQETVIKSLESIDEDTIRLSWNAVPGAGSYSIYRMNGSTWVKVATAKSTDTSWDFKSSDKEKITPGKTYRFTVRARKNNKGKFTFGPYSKTGIAIKAPSYAPKDDRTDLQKLTDQFLSYFSDPGMSRSQKLERCWNYITSKANISYVRKYDPFAPSQIPVRAESFMKNHCGNCYDFASAFATLANRAGYTAYVVYGMCPAARGGLTPHAWVFVTELGYFDPEAAWAGWGWVYRGGYNPYTEYGRALGA